jgi:hypothetical protein
MQKIYGPPAFQRPSGKLKLSADQLNLLNGNATKIALDTIPVGYTDAIEDTVNNRITPGIAGYYCLVGQIEFKSVVVDKAYKVEIRLSGNIVSEFIAHASHAFPITALSCLPCHILTAVNYVELWATSYSGDNTVDIGSSVLETYLAVQRVR